MDPIIAEVVDILEFLDTRVEQFLEGPIVFILQGFIRVGIYHADGQRAGTKFVQVRVLPAQNNLKDVVQSFEALTARNAHTPPDQRLDLDQLNTQHRGR